MKNTSKNITILLLLMLSLNIKAQQQFYFTGTITDSITNQPAADHPVMIFSEDLSFSILTYTNEQGIYYDSVFTVNKPAFTLVLDCYGNDHTKYFHVLDTINTADFNICVTSGQYCQAAFNYEPDSNDYQTIHFENISSGNYNNVQWDFGDGFYSSEENPTHKYQYDGMYLVNLIISDSSNPQCLSSFNALIDVMECNTCNAEFSYSMISADNNTFTYQFNDMSSGNINSYYWDFGDGEIGFEANPVHSFSSPGNYYVTLYIQDSITFCQDYIVKKITTPKNFIFNGKVTDSINQNPLISYPVYLSALDSVFEIKTDSNGLYNIELQLLPDDTVSVYVYDCYNNKITSYFTQLEPENTANFNICVYHETCNAAFDFYLDSLNNTPYVYKFFDLSSGDTAFRFWDFGDGNYSYEQNPEHIYQEGGNYFVTLTVSSPSGECSDTITKEISTPQYYNFGGQVFIGDFPLNNQPGDSTNKATAYLFRKMNNRWYFMEQRDFWELGYYWFINKLEGEYLIRIDLKNESDVYGDFAPTYYINHSNWIDANVFYLNDTSYQETIWMKTLINSDNGIGTISGTLYEESRDSLDLNNILIELFTGKGEITSYTYTDQNGEFHFDQLAAGNYTILPELPGYCGEDANVSITNDEPNISNVKCIIYDCQATGIDNITDASESVDIYPNPASSKFTIRNINNHKSKIKLVILNLLGDILEKQILELTDNTSESINISNFNNGIYLIKITDLQQNTIITKKLVINR